MNVLTKTHGLLIPLIGMTLFIAGCASSPNSSQGSRIHTVNVGPKIEPLQINAGRGDEVRWMNSRSQPIAVIFPTSDDARISCRSGFKKIDSALTAVVAPHAFASMCFSEAGKYDYRIRLDENVPSAETDRIASVWIVGGGERNPKPGEAFENVTP
ncbi:MAG TPA: hypothetical protein VL261_10725 [Nitrospira sp.]|jgi:plastocyanin|nr:hypothetical protein [Nitrospira sp.]